MTTLRDIIKQAKEQGFEVYAPENLGTYFFFTRDNKVGYCQFSGVSGVSFSTVHKPNKTTGTGYPAGSFDEALQNRPAWASIAAPVVKYASIDEFLSKYWQPLVAY